VTKQVSTKQLKSWPDRRANEQPAGRGTIGKIAERLRQARLPMTRTKREDRNASTAKFAI